VKEREIEIGHPTDVKHVAHIGWDGPNGNGPSWVCIINIIHVYIYYFVLFLNFATIY